MPWFGGVGSNVNRSLGILTIGLFSWHPFKLGDVRPKFFGHLATWLWRQLTQLSPNRVDGEARREIGPGSTSKALKRRQI